MGTAPNVELDKYERSSIENRISGFITDEACLMYFRTVDEGLGEPTLEFYTIPVVVASMVAGAIGGLLLAVPVFGIAVAIAVAVYRSEQCDRHGRFLRWQYTARQIHKRFPNMVDEFGHVNTEYEFVGRDTRTAA